MIGGGIRCPVKPGMTHGSNQPDRKKGLGGRGYEGRRIGVHGNGPPGRYRKERQHFCQQGEGDFRSDNPVDARRIVLRIGQDIYMRGAAAAVVVMVVVFPVAVVVDAFAGYVAI